MPVWNIAWDEIKKGDVIVDTLKKYGENLKEQTSGKLSYKIDFEFSTSCGIRYMFFIQVSNSYHHSVRLLDVEYNIGTGNISFTCFTGNGNQSKSGLSKPRKVDKCIEKYMDKIVAKKETSGLLRLLLMQYEKTEQEKEIEKQNIK